MEYIRRLCKHIDRIEGHQRSEIGQQIHDLSLVLMSQARMMIVDEAAEAHLRLAATVHASYQIVSSYIENERYVLDLIQDVFCGINKRLMRIYTSLLLRFSLNPFKTMIRVSLAWIERSYGDRFSFRFAGDEESQFLISVETCLFHDYFVKHGVPELTQVFCAWDNNWAEVVNPDVHGFTFHRGETIATGADVCDFRFSLLPKE
jgi:hypothetical protein